MRNRHRKQGINIDKFPLELNAEQLDKIQQALREAVKCHDVDTVTKIVDRYGNNAEVMNVMETRYYVKYPLLNHLINPAMRLSTFPENLQTMRLLLQAPAFDANLAGAANMNNPENVAPIHIIFMSRNPLRETQFSYLSALLERDDVNVNIETTINEYENYYSSSRGLEIERNIIPVFEAIKSSDPRLFEALTFHKSFDPNKEYSLGRYLLLEIIKSKNVRHKYDYLADLLAVERMNPNVVTDDGKSALYLAVVQQDIACIKQLKAVNPNLPDKSGNTALHAAIETESPEVVAAILARPDIDVNAQNKVGATPLQYALKMMHGKKGEANTEIVRLLLAHPAVRVTIQDNEGNNALHYAAYYGFEEFVEAIITRETMIAVTAKGKEEADTKTIISDEIVDPNQLNKKGQTALILATKAGRENVALKLLSLNCPVIYCDNDKSLMSYALLSGNLNLVTAITQKLSGSRMVMHEDADGNCALHIAVLCKRADFLTLVLNANQNFPREPCDCDIRNKSGDTPLMLAAQHGDVAMVKALIAAGASVMMENKIHEKPSEIALAAGNPHIAKVLIEVEMKQAYGKVSDMSMFKPALEQSAGLVEITATPKPQVK